MLKPRAYFLHVFRNPDGERVLVGHTAGRIAEWQATMAVLDPRFQNLSLEFAFPTCSRDAKKLSTCLVQHFQPIYPCRRDAVAVADDGQRIAATTLYQLAKRIGCSGGSRQLWRAMVAGLPLRIGGRFWTFLPGPDGDDRDDSPDSEGLSRRRRQILS